LVSRRSELGTLKHQISLQRPSLSIRNLIELMPTTFTKLAPCMLMSPLSVAQYLPSNQAQFDVIIFDEASQITTWDAVGAIARAQQSVIVGDPKQLPPTNFFGRTDDEDEKDLVEYEKDLPSILEEASAAGLPEIQLNWHYRSRDESLIAFSNWHYYNGRLITFPSPQTESHSIIFHKNNGVYARGAGRTNIEEAREIVNFSTNNIKQWMQVPENERPTLGVITFNIQQQELILNLFDKARQNDPTLEWYFSDERDEPVIVKNIENIQGDERDIMCFSITFGRDLAGKLPMSFGAVNRDGGEKRLNVAVTRARLEMHIFSSISADDIDTSRTQALGVAHLQNFLDYAQRGSVALAAMTSDSVGDAESPFEEAVMAALRNKGWEVRPQIGVSNYRIDLGIVHPDHAGAYLAGIECDGATYHRSASARDRDKIRESVLRSLGWNIVRVWSTDWFMNCADALKRIHSELQKLLINSREAEKTDEKNILSIKNTNKNSSNNLCETKIDENYNDNILETEIFSQHFVNRTKYCNQNTKFQLPCISEINTCSDNAKAKLPTETPIDLQRHDGDNNTATTDATRFFDADYTPVLTQLINILVKVEGPIELDRLAQKICKAHGWNRTGAKIKQRVMSCLGRNELHPEDDKMFVWEFESFKENIPFRHIPERDTNEISRHEIFGLIASHPELVNSDDLVRDIADLMGIKRLSQKSKVYISDIITAYNSDLTPLRIPLVS
jgi:Superfamily I DNA and RNA helicases and helicase subunits